MHLHHQIISDIYGEYNAPEGGEDDALLQRLLGLHLARDVGEAAALARLYHLAHHNLREHIFMSGPNIISSHLHELGGVVARLLAVHGGGDGVCSGPRRRHRLRAGQAALVGPPGGLRGVGACRGLG